MRRFPRLLLCALLGHECPAEPCAGPVAGPDLVLWLDARDAGGESLTPEAPADGTPLAAWHDKSSHRHHARQSEPARRPVLARDALGPGRHAVRFTAPQRQFLATDPSPGLNLHHLTAFVVARARPAGGDAWLLSKNSWGPPWSGYGIAVSRDGLRAWPHLGLDTGNHGYLRFGGALDHAFRLVEIRFDGTTLQGQLEENRASTQAATGRIAPNPLPLALGTLGDQFLDGEIAEVLLYRRALGPEECRQTRHYLLERHGLAATRDDPADSPLLADWLFQAQGTPAADRARQEIGWARQLAARLAADPRTPSLAAELAELDRLENLLGKTAAPPADESAARQAYFAVRKVKREITFKNPVVDFRQILLIDQPQPQGPEASHEAVHRLGMMAVPGGRLLVLDGLHPDAPVRDLLPGHHGSFWRPDLSFDARTALFCFKPAGDSSFHLYQVNLDGSGLRQLTDGPYDDIDPIHLPDGHILFTTTRGNTYVRCGPYIYSNTLARCNADGGEIYLISTNSEPDFLPALLDDGKVVYSRWEYSDKDQNRVQSLWTTLPDGRHTTVLWGNQSVWPDHLAEPRPIPGTTKVMFTATGHHDWFHGAIGIVDPRAGTNFPHGLSRVTFDLPWPEVGNPPAEDRAESADYHPAGRFTGYMAPFPLSAEDFLVSARGEGDKFRLYLMDVHGNRELICEGLHHAWYAIPVRERPAPPRHPDLVAWPGTGEHRTSPKPGVYYNSDVCEGVPDLPREKVKFLRVLQQDAKTYSTWQKVFAFSGPAVSAVQTDAVKRVVSTVPVEADGSVHFEVPAGRALYFQLLDEHQRAVHTMRSFTGVMPGERRTCVGCHGQRNDAPPYQAGLALRRPPTPLSPPPWGDESIGYERFVQPVLDKYCVDCHKGPSGSPPDLTLRPAAGDFALFKEPYLTLIGQAAWPVAVPGAGNPGHGIAAAIPVYGLRPDDVYPAAATTDPASVIQRELRPLRYLSPRSRLVDLAMDGRHYGVKVDPTALLRLITWVDANAPFLGEEEIRAMKDPDFPGIERLPVRPRLQTAPAIPRP